MATQLSNYFLKRRNRSGTNSGSESDSPDFKRAKNLNSESCVSETQDGDVIIDALEMTGEISGTLNEILEKFTKLDTIESSNKDIEVSFEILTASLENFQQSATQEME